jgi:threonine 3-dehydrogenase
MIFGHEFCGEIVEVGDRVSAVKPGDLVAAETHIPCEQCYQCTTGNQHICENMKIVGVHSDGAFADFAWLPETCAWKLSPDTPPELGAILEPLGVATHGVLVDRVDGRSVAVFGCGPIGLFALAVAEACGASKLFAVEVNSFRLGMAPLMAPDAILIDAKRADVVQAILDATAGRGVDVSIELTGNPLATQQAFKVLRKGGRISIVGLAPGPVELDLVSDIVYKEARVFGTTGRRMWDTWWEMDKLLSTGRLDPLPVITHKLPLGEIDQAIQLARSGQAGKILMIP